MTNKAGSQARSLDGFLQSCASMPLVRADQARRRSGVCFLRWAAREFAARAVADLLLSAVLRASKNRPRTSSFGTEGVSVVQGNLPAGAEGSDVLFSGLR